MKLDTNKALKSVKYNNVDVPLASGLNIAYGLTPPADTSKLWVKIQNEAEFVKTKFLFQFGDEYFEEGIRSLPTSQYQRAMRVGWAGNYGFSWHYRTGYANSSYIDRYNPKTQTWDLTKSVSLYMSESLSTSINGKLYTCAQNGSSDSTWFLVEIDENLNINKYSGSSFSFYRRSMFAVGSRVYILPYGDGGVTNGVMFDTETQIYSTISTSGSTDKTDYRSLVFGSTVWLLPTMKTDCYIYKFDVLSNSYVKSNIKLRDVLGINYMLPSAVCPSTMPIAGNTSYLLGIYDSNTNWFGDIYRLTVTEDSIVGTKISASMFSGFSSTTDGSATFTMGLSPQNEIFVGIAKEVNKFSKNSKLVIYSNLDKDTLLLQQDFGNNNVSLVKSKNADISMSLKHAWFGNELSKAILVDAYLYDNVQNKWISLEGTPYTA